MKIGVFLDPDRVILDLRSPNKPRMLDELSRRAAKILNIDAQTIFDALKKREQLGSTGVGDGIAIPHARLEGMKEVVGFFARIKPPVEFDAIDARKVDLLFLLLTPSQASSDHLNALASVSRLLRNSDVSKTLRGADSAEQLYSILTT